MSRPLLIAMPGHELLAQSLARSVEAELGQFELRRFPDGETYLRYLSSPEGRPVAVLASLDRPDDKVLPLLFAAKTARSLGAHSVGLVCPYLPYMRQDRRFKPGEAVSSAHFASIVSAAFDWLITVDPHLHRRSSLSEIYTIPATVLHAAPLIADWIGQSVKRPLLIGPDAESEQWVAAVARDAGAAHIVLEKVRKGDRNVRVSVPDVERWRTYTPVVVDDIVSTARTMIETLRHLGQAHMQAAVCLAVHGIFAGKAYQDLFEAGAERVATCNTILHASNAIDVTDLLAEALRYFVSTNGGGGKSL